MNFVHLEFLWFFILVLTTYWIIQKRRAQNVFLIVCSAIFYGWIHPWFLILLYSSAILDYQMGLRMQSQPHNKKRYLFFSLLGNLGMLGYFKYSNFFIANVVSVFQQFGLNVNVSSLDIILPVGISFFTFQTMSYTIDIYRGNLQPRKRFLDYLVFISFFPQLVAGPIERAANLLPQMEKDRVFRWESLTSGLSLALWGAFKKVCIADTLGEYVDEIFRLSDPSGAMIWAATLGFTIQILADFSGYTDIARGIARMLGFELTRNFKYPYLAANPVEYWKRWHVSFSTWIRDYLYIPLGGSRGSKLNTLKATFGAMMLSGLWHGASWTFVLWGTYHAILLTSYRAVRVYIPQKLREAQWTRPFAVATMFLFTVVGYLIFRETNLNKLGEYFMLSPLEGSVDQFFAASVMLAMSLLCASPLVVAVPFQKHILPRLKKSIWYHPLQTTFWGFVILCIRIMYRSTDNDFIYFQF